MPKRKQTSENMFQPSKKRVQQFLQETIEEINEEYEVEKVLKHRDVGGKIEFFVKWVGYPNSDNTWEPYENLVFDDGKFEYSGARVLIDQYFENLSQKKKVKQENREQQKNNCKQENLEDKNKGRLTKQKSNQNLRQKRQIKKEQKAGKKQQKQLEKEKGKEKKQQQQHQQQISIIKDDELQQIKNLNNHDDSTTDPENCSIELLEYVNLKELQILENQKYQQEQQEEEEGEEQKKQLNSEKYISEENQYFNQNIEPNKQIYFNSQEAVLKLIEDPSEQVNNENEQSQQEEQIQKFQQKYEVSDLNNDSQDIIINQQQGYNDFNNNNDTDSIENQPKFKQKNRVEQQENSQKKDISLSKIQNNEQQQQQQELVEKEKGAFEEIQQDQKQAQQKRKGDIQKDEIQGFTVNCQEVNRKEDIVFDVSWVDKSLENTIISYDEMKKHNLRAIIYFYQAKMDEYLKKQQNELEK